jgi:hypothetical protein
MRFGISTTSEQVECSPAAERAASLAPSTAIPQSAFLSDGASFTPYKNVSLRSVHQSEATYVSRHGGQMAALLKHFDNLVFMLGKHFRETICTIVSPPTAKRRV